MIVEGVEYHRYVITFRWADGRRARWVRWAPNDYFMREQFIRELDGRDIEPEGICPRSVQIVLADKVSTV